MQDGQQLNMTIRKKGGKLVLVMMPDTKGVKDNAVSTLEPMVMNGTPQEFEEQFEQAMAPIAKAFSLLEEIGAYEKNLEEVRKKSEMESKKKKEEDTKKQSYLDHMALAKKLLGEQKFKDARTVLAKAEAMEAAVKKDCDALKAEIDEKSGAGGLFGGAEDKSDGKELAPGKTKAAAPAPAKSDDEQEDEPDNEEE